MPPARAAVPVISQEMTKLSTVPMARQLTALATLRAWLSTMRYVYAHAQSMAQH